MLEINFIVKKSKMKKNKNPGKIGIFVLLIISIIFLTFVYAAQPEGGSLTYVSNSNKNVTKAEARNDTKGTITTVNIDAIQQETKWKAYVGNVTGTLVLKDASAYSIYEWTSITDPSGVVYISRADQVEWANIKCANTTHIENEEIYLNHSTSAGDNIQNTFSYQAHESFWVGDITEITNSSCYSTATYINNTVQSVTEDSLYQELLLYDDTNLIFATILEQDVSGYKDDNSTTYDFQSIVPDSALPGSTGQVEYYFYVEIDAE